MATGSAPTDPELDAELAALRSRAYGADADIDRDPAALSRLAELEEWHASVLTRHEPSSEDGPDGEPAARARAAAPETPEPDIVPEGSARTPAQRLASLAVKVVVVVAAGVVIVGLATIGEPRPDAVLQPLGTPPDEQTLRLADNARSMLVDESTLEDFEPFLGLRVWRAETLYGSTCLLVIEPSTDELLATACAPPGAGVIADIYDVPLRSTDDWHEGQPIGTVARFVLEGDAVEAWIYHGVPPG